MKYRHCRMRQGNAVHIAFLPENLAKMGKSVKIDDMDGEWEIFQVSESRVDEDSIRRLNLGRALFSRERIEA